jgi:hypothetical protein
MAALRALKRYQARFAPQRRDRDDILHCCAASGAGRSVVSFASLFVRHNARPWQMGYPQEVTSYVGVGCSREKSLDDSQRNAQKNIKASRDCCSARKAKPSSLRGE